MIDIKVTILNHDKLPFPIECPFCKENTILLSTILFESIDGGDKLIHFERIDACPSCLACLEAGLKKAFKEANVSYRDR